MSATGLKLATNVITEIPLFKPKYLGEYLVLKILGIASYFLPSVDELTYCIFFE